MSSSPLDLGKGANVRWTVPGEIKSRSDIDTVYIFRSNRQNDGYAKISEQDYKTASGDYNNYFTDPTNTSRYGKYYLITFKSSTTSYESPWHLTFFDPLPVERWFIEQIRRATPQVIQDTMTDEDYLNGLYLAVGIFNSYPPQTYFTAMSFPGQYAFFIVGLATMTALTSRFLPISIRDWRYSEPGGVVMDIDRGSKIQQALEIIADVFTKQMPIVKLDFADDLPIGVGTIQLPLSMGGIVSRGLLNVLDIFTATGR